VSYERHFQYIHGIIKKGLSFVASRNKFSQIVKVDINKGRAKNKKQSYCEIFTKFVNKLFQTLLSFTARLLLNR